MNCFPDLTDWYFRFSKKRSFANPEPYANEWVIKFHSTHAVAKNFVTFGFRTKDKFIFDSSEKEVIKRMNGGEGGFSKEAYFYKQTWNEIFDCAFLYYGHCPFCECTA